MSHFILMLTRNDVTVPDAADLLKVALDSPVEHIGFKDVGLPVEAMRDLVSTIRAAGRSAHLEVVSLTEDDERRSIEIGIDLGVDYILGGTRWQLGSKMVEGTGASYFPYAGEVIGHPGTLDGTATTLLADIEQMAEDVTGVNLLAYRHVRLAGDDLVREVCARSPIPVLVAGSIGSPDRIRHVASAGAWGFTIGAAALDGKVVPGANLDEQLRAAVEAGRANEGTTS